MNSNSPTVEDLQKVQNYIYDSRQQAKSEDYKEAQESLAKFLPLVRNDGRIKTKVHFVIQTIGLHIEALTENCELVSTYCTPQCKKKNRIIWLTPTAFNTVRNKTQSDCEEVQFCHYEVENEDEATTADLQNLTQMCKLPLTTPGISVDIPKSCAARGDEDNTLRLEHELNQACTISHIEEV